MTVPVSYERMSVLCLRLLQRFGGEVALVREEESGPPYQPVIEDVDYPAQFLSVGFDGDEDPALVTGTSVKGLLRCSDIEPDVTDRLRLDGQVLSITALTAHRPRDGGPTLAWEVVADV